MSIFTAGQAAKAVGVSTPTITKACKSGRLSYRKREGGGFEIEAAELFRVFPPATDKGVKSGSVLGSLTPESVAFTAQITAELEALKTRFDDQKRERERDQQIMDDLRHERDHWRSEATANRRLIEDLTQKQEARPVSWWERLRGKSKAA
tara:strand:- start:44 stop:493 length:450 start_codon:yes stop_codon:yes gene_type:complete